MTESKKHPAVGIDLGTTFSAVAFLDNRGRPETIRSAEGDMTTPSAVFFDRKNPIVGTEAVEAGLLEPERLALYAKRDVGEDAYEKKIQGEEFPPEVLQALILQKLKLDAELKLGKISKAVVTVPAFFNEPCRKATQDAAVLAGLELLDIINEPTAAAITYGVQQGFLSEDGKAEKQERVLVYDLGGGTFDVTLMEIEDANFNTIATAGDVYLGGIDWDRRIVDYIAEAFIAQHGVDPREDPRGEQELMRKANQAKHALTQRESVSISMAFEGDRLRTELSQEQFAKLCEDLVERTLMTVQLVLDDASMNWSDLTRLILVGGSTRMPMIRDELHLRSGIELDRSLSPDEAVCHGAALYAGMLLGHPDGEHANVSVTNVNSNDLGILAIDPKTGNPRRQIMIPRNSSLPAKKQMRFRTHSDNQVNVKIEIVEGGDGKGTNATRIGKCVINDLPAGLAKGTEVDVSFDYSQDGRLTLSALLPSVDRKVQMTLNRAAGLSPTEIETWQKRMTEGLKDPDPKAIVETSNHTLPADTKPTADNAETTSPSPFAIVTEKRTRDSSDKTKPKLKPQTPKIDVGPTGKPTTPKPSASVPHMNAEAKNSAIRKPAVKKPVLKKPIVKQPEAADSSSAAKTRSKGPMQGSTAQERPAVKTPAKKPVLRPSAPQTKPTSSANATEAGTAKTGKPKPKLRPVQSAPAEAASQVKPIPLPRAKPKPAATKPTAVDKTASKSGDGAKLDLGNLASAEKPVAKPGAPDFSKIMSLGGEPKKPASHSKSPVIITTNEPPSGKKKVAPKKKGQGE